MFLRIIDPEHKQFPIPKIAAQAHKVALFDSKRRCELSHIEDRVFRLKKRGLPLVIKYHTFGRFSLTFAAFRKPTHSLGIEAVNR